MSTFTLYQGDCLQIMPTLARVDAIITDLPYGTTACSWDEIIPFAPMWAEVKRILKPRGVFVTTAREPFTSKLVISNINWYKHKWVWDKAQSGSFQNAKFMPLQVEEDIIVFGDGSVNYYPIMSNGKTRKKGGQKNSSELFSGLRGGFSSTNNIYYPTNIIRFPNCANKSDNVHPTQKPTALYRYLILTYTNPGDTVLDITAGSGTTGVACMETGRNFIGIEKDPHHFATMQTRVENAAAQPLLPFEAV